jgi:membrane protein implicated in regulation of membrane protease activity
MPMFPAYDEHPGVMLGASLMQTHFLWLIVGIVLIIAELLTGTFYLLFLGMAALVGAAVAFLGGPLWLQAIVAAACAAAGVVWVQRHRRFVEQKPMPSLDVGQPVSFETWVSQSDGLARVKYRDADWEARVSGECAGQPGELLYITGVDGNTLHVSRRRAA